MRRAAPRRWGATACHVRRTATWTRRRGVQLAPHAATVGDRSRVEQPPGLAVRCWARQSMLIGKAATVSRLVFVERPEEPTAPPPHLAVPAKAIRTRITDAIRRRGGESAI